MDNVGVTNKKTQALVNGLINIWNWALALTSAFFAERVGRHPLFGISKIGMLLVFTGWTIASEPFTTTEAKSAGVAVMALIFVYEIFYCIAFSPLLVAYSVETKGKALEEIAVIFDGEAANVTVDETARSKAFIADIPTSFEQENVDRKV
ncbi:hypothetical protein ACHAPU_011454 [Fusarium lateritium]